MKCMPGWKFNMKLMIALALLVTASLVPGRKNSAHPRQPVGLQPVPAGEATSCNIAGADYPVDPDGQIWALGNNGQWIVVGHMVQQPKGFVAARNDGTLSPASCQGK